MCVLASSRAPLMPSKRSACGGCDTDEAGGGDGGGDGGSRRLLRCDTSTGADAGAAAGAAVVVVLPLLLRRRRPPGTGVFFGPPTWPGCRAGSAAVAGSWTSRGIGDRGSDNITSWKLHSLLVVPIGEFAGDVVTVPIVVVVVVVVVSGVVPLPW